jgi:hypothetical protein
MNDSAKAFCTDLPGAMLGNLAIVRPLQTFEVSSVRLQSAIGYSIAIALPPSHREPAGKNLAPGRSIDV